MNKKISIIIPYYNESEERIFPLLASINGQVGIDFNQIEVVLINDSDNKFPDLFFKNFYYIKNIRIIISDKRVGPGVARQIGIDNAKGEYCLFCDADDTLHNIAVLGLFINTIKENNTLNIIATDWLEELYIDSIYTYVTHSNEATWLHGKLIRRQFLVDNDIRFHSELWAHEDSYFLSICYALSTNTILIPITTYLWKYNDGNSITRRENGLYTFNLMDTHVKAIFLSFEVIERKNKSHMEYKVIQYSIYIYFMTQKKVWQETNNRDHLNKMLIAFREEIPQYAHYYKNASQETINKIYAEERTKSFYGELEKELFTDWMEKMLSSD